MKVRLAAIVTAFSFIGAFSAEVRPIFAPGAKTLGPYSPAVRVGDFLYVSGQTALGADGQIPTDEEAQFRTCLTNIQTLVKAAGLTMEHVVYVQVFLTHYQDEGALNKVWKEFFPKTPPARATTGMAKLPAGSPVEMTAVAFADLSRKKAIVPPGYPASVPISPAMQAGNRLYLSGFLGRDVNTGKIPDDPGAQVQLALDRMAQTLKVAGLDFRHMVFINPYLTNKIPMDVMNRIYAKHFEFGNTPARATIQVAGLPSDANMQFTGVAVMDLALRRAVRPKNMAPSPTASPCVFADDTYFCSAKSGFIPGINGGIYASTVENQLRQTMRNLLDNLEEADMTFANVVSTHVYLDNMDDFAGMNGVYKTYFSGIPPVRTTLQQREPVVRKANEKEHWPTLEQISLIAVK
jgi:reactive intermediate/imine deaminase